MFHPLPNHDGAADMSQLHVLGIGSPFGDDQVGWEAIQLLQQKPALDRFHPDQLHIAYCDRPGMHLLELMKPAQTVVLIDAIKTGAMIGSVQRFQNEEIEGVNDSLSTHDLGIAAAIKMGAALQVLPPNVILYGIEVNDLHFQFLLSEPIQQAVKSLSARVEREILSILSPR